MILRYLLLLLCCLSFTSCVMQQQLQSESGLYQVPLSRSLKVAVDGYYVRPNPEGMPLPGKGTIYVAPMDISLVRGSADECLPAMQQDMHRYLCTEIAAALKETYPNGEWTLTDDAAHATLRFETALVRFRPQRPLLRGVATLASPFIEIPFVSTAVKKFANGDICIEGAIRYQQKTPVLVAAFKDSNRESAAFYESAAYRPTGNAEVNLRIWAKKMARFIYAESVMTSHGKSFEQELEERSFTDTVKAYAE